MFSRIKRVIASLPFFLASVIKYYFNKGSFKGKKNIAISLITPSYKQFYSPIVDLIIRDPEYNVICFGTQMYNLKTYSQFTQMVMSEPLIILCADMDLYIKKENHRRIQIFHSLVSFGSVWGEKFITRFDIIFSLGPYMSKQLKEPVYERLVTKHKVRIFDVGYPKLDSLCSNKRINTPNGRIFYGPTYHTEFSSIFNWCEQLMIIAKTLKLELVIKLHPYLYLKENKSFSGGVDWENQIQHYKNNYGTNVKLLPTDISLDQQRKEFESCDLIITDVSGIGYEFVLATSKPIIYLENKIKIPIGSDEELFLNHFENKIREELGPIIYTPEELTNSITELIYTNNSPKYLEKIKDEFVFNIGKASERAISIVDMEFKEINNALVK